MALLDLKVLLNSNFIVVGFCQHGSEAELFVCDLHAGCKLFRQTAWLAARECRVGRDMQQWEYRIAERTNRSCPAETSQWWHLLPFREA